MPTRNVVLTEPQAQFVEQLVFSGRYQNASEVMRDGLRLIQQREQEQIARLQTLREAVVVGINDINTGQFSTFDSAESLTAHIESLAKSVEVSAQ